MYSKSKLISILVVEDNPLIRLLMQTILEDMKFQFEMASNGKDGIELLLKRNFDIVIMDLQMPVMNGFDTTDYIRNKLKLNLPILALTSDISTLDIEKCRQAGINDWLPKPVEEEKLYQKIMDCVNPEYRKKPDATIYQFPDKEDGNYINLSELKRRTKNNAKLMMEMIRLFLNQTPPLINTMRAAFTEKDWTHLSAAAHKIIPSFSIMGIPFEYEKMARTIQANSEAGERPDETMELITALERMCAKSIVELEASYSELNSLPGTEK